MEVKTSRFAASAHGHPRTPSPPRLSLALLRLTNVESILAIRAGSTVEFRRSLNVRSQPELIREGEKMPLNPWSARRRDASGRLRLLAAAALAVAATAAGASPANAESGSPAGADARLLRLTPRQINPVVSLGDSAISTVTVTNISNDSVRLVGAEVSGDNLGLDWKFAEGCFGNLLVPGGACSYTMTFTPITAGRVSGTFCVTGITEPFTVADRECGGIHGVAV